MRQSINVEQWRPCISGVVDATLHNNHVKAWEHIVVLLDALCEAEEKGSIPESLEDAFATLIDFFYLEHQYSDGEQLCRALLKTQESLLLPDNASLELTRARLVTLREAQKYFVEDRNGRISKIDRYSKYCLLEDVGPGHC